MLKVRIRLKKTNNRSNHLPTAREIKIINIMDGVAKRNAGITATAAIVATRAGMVITTARHLHPEKILIIFDILKSINFFL
jgi:hypothetical protein